MANRLALTTPVACTSPIRCSESLQMPLDWRCFVSPNLARLEGVRRLTATLVLCLMAVFPAARAQTGPPADALARSLQQRYQGIRDFSADFVHSYRGGVL